MATARARALAIPEIVYEIVGRVDLDYGPERRRFFVGLAQVSRVFHDPAERMLWEDLPNIEPLFRLLSNCVPIPTTAGPHAYTMTLHGPTSAEDIARLREYASRVRVLDFPRGGEAWREPSDRPLRGISLEPHALANLLLQTGLPVLPSLRKLKLPVKPPYNSDPTFLLCPSLRELTISFPANGVNSVNDNIAVLFGGIFPQTPRLTHLRLQSECYMHHDSDDVLIPWQHDFNDWHFADTQDTQPAFQIFCDALAAVAMLNDLEVFSMLTMNVGVVGQNLVAALSTLPRLRDCSFGIYIAAGVLSTIPAGFNALHTLAISNVTRGDELRLFDSPLLRSLIIYHPDVIEDDCWHRTVEAVAERFPHLHRLSWKLGNYDVSPTRILAETVQPLFSLDGLRELSINVGHRRIYDDDIALLVAGLPQLSHLEIKYYMKKFGPSAQSLLTLAQRCSFLRTLHLGGIFITEKDEADTKTYPYVGNRLRNLNIFDLRCEGEIYAAMIIDMLFPFLNVEESRRLAAKARWPKGQFPGVLDRLEAYHAERE